MYLRIKKSVRDDWSPFSLLNNFGETVTKERKFFL
jgi:hypothetical protein